MAILDSLVDDYVERRMRSEVTPEEVRDMKDLVLNKVVSEALTHAETKQLCAMQERIEAEALRAKNKIDRKHISTVIAETIFLAIAVGILVNQLFSWISIGSLSFSGLAVLVVCVSVIFGLGVLLSGMKLGGTDDA